MLELFAAPLFRLGGYDVALNDLGVFIDLDVALPLGFQHIGIAVLVQKAPDVLARLPQGAIR